MKTGLSIALGLAMFAIGCLVARGPNSAFAGTVDGGRPFLAVTTTVDQNHEVMWLVDTESHMMAMYDGSRGEAIRLVAVRNFEWDLNTKILDFPKKGQGPSAEDMKKLFDKPEGQQGAAAPGNPGH